MARNTKASGDGLMRIGVAIEEGLLRRFDAWLGARGGGNRSEAFRDLIRDRLISADIDEQSDVVASVSLVYDHHHRELNRRLTDLQHHHGEMVVSALHVHIEHDRCLEVVVLRGRACDVRAFADRLIGEKGVVHGGVFMTRRLEALRGGARTARKRAHPHDHVAPHVDDHEIPHAHDMGAPRRDPHDLDPAPSLGARRARPVLSSKRRTRS